MPFAIYCPKCRAYIGTVPDEFYRPPEGKWVCPECGEEADNPEAWPMHIEPTSY